MGRRSWHPIHLDDQQVEAILAGRQTQIRKAINPTMLVGWNLAEPLQWLGFLSRCPYEEKGHTLWSQEARTQRESGARLWLTVEHIQVQRLYKVRDEEIRAEGAGEGFIPYDQLWREWRAQWERHHTRKGETWDDAPRL